MLIHRLIGLQSFGEALKVIEKREEKLIHAFACATMASSALEAEMQAFLRGTQLCISQGISEVIIEGDSFHHLELTKV